jgi:hypothetical protein
MSSLPVFADTLSRLHADIALVRLVRAGLSPDRISAVFPSRSAPNGVCCWLKNFHRVPRAQLPMAAAGLLGKLFRRGIQAAHIEQELDELGLSTDVTKRLVERTEDGRIVLCVHARTESEAAIAWHIFHHVGAENISLPAGDAFFTPNELPVLVPQFAGMAA